MVKSAPVGAVLGLSLLSSVSASNAQCISSSLPTGSPTGTNAIQLVFSGFGGTELGFAQAGYGQWNRSTCNAGGTAFPVFQESATGANRVIQVSLIPGLNPTNQNSCGNYNTATGVIKMYTQARNPGTGMIVSCTSGPLLQDTMAHELGHALGLNNVGASCSSYIMSPASFTAQNQYNDTRAVQQAECNKVAGTNTTPAEAPPTPPPPPDGGTDPSPGCDPTSCSPIILLLEPGPPELTGVDDPVDFDVDADGVLERIGWTQASYSRGGFLVLDRDGDGWIEDGSELFGSATEQEPSTDPNGFRALELFDHASRGGDQDGLIGRVDAVFDDLAVWFDGNHDGLSQADELTPLEETDVQAIELDYRSSPRHDEHGNELRWWSQVRFTHGKRPAAVDVIFVVAP